MTDTRGTSQVAIVKTGTANLASVVAAVDRAGFEPRLTSDPSLVLNAERLILPGVGTFLAAMRELETLKLVEPLRQRIAADRPTLGICLGLQLFCRVSEENPGVRGLGVIDEEILRFEGAPGLRVPQMGWNLVQPDAGFGLVAQKGFAYFANSYRLTRHPVGWAVCTTEYAGRFVSAVRRSNVVACQFHPELSGPWGASLMNNWFNLTPATPAASERR